MRRWVLAAGLMALLAGCAAETPPQPPTTWPLGQTAGGPTALPNALAPLQYNVCELGFTMLRDLAASRSGDIFISPAAAAVALALLHEAAAAHEGPRLRELCGLGGLAARDVTSNAEALREMLLRPGAGVTSQASMSVWLPAGHTISTAFASVSRGRYKARVRAGDFSSPGARDAIDRWFRQVSVQKVPTAPLPPPPEDMFLGANALVHGSWTDPPAQADTRPGTFTAADGTTRTMDFMHQTTTARYADLGRAQRLDLPLGGGKVCLTLLRPTADDGLQPLLERLTPERWAEATTEGRMVTAEVALPKLEMVDVTRLDDVLRIDGLDVSAASNKPLHLGQLWLVTPLIIDEWGLNATPPISAPSEDPGPMPDDQVSFRADRPFAFIVTQAAGNLPLYAGVIR